MKSYFSQKEYAAFITASTDHVALQWLALAGVPLNLQQKTQFEQLLAKFFLTTQHHSLKQHQQ